MSTFIYDLNPVQFIIADAMGEPGKRTFFLQGRAGSQLVSLVLEKQEVGNLAISVLQLLEELETSNPKIKRTTPSKRTPKPEQPMDPYFRVGQLSIGYNEEDDTIWLIAKALVATEEGEVIDPNRDDVPAVRFVATREQMRFMGEHAMEVIGKGRPVCPLCGRPIERDGHFCERTDGHAMPVIF